MKMRRMELFQEKNSKVAIVSESMIGGTILRIPKVRLMIIESKIMKVKVTIVNRLSFWKSQIHK